MDLFFSVFNSTLTFTEPFILKADETMHLYVMLEDLSRLSAKLNDDVYYTEAMGLLSTIFVTRFRTLTSNKTFLDDALSYVASETDTTLSDIQNKDDWKLILKNKMDEINNILDTLIRSTRYDVQDELKHPDMLQHSSGVKYLPKFHPLNIAYQVYEKSRRYFRNTISSTNVFGDVVSKVDFKNGDTLSFDLLCNFIAPVPSKSYRFTYHMVTEFYIYPTIPIISYSGWKSSAWQPETPMAVLPIDLTKTKTYLQVYNDSDFYARQSTDYDTELVNLNMFYNSRGIYFFPYVSSSVIPKKYVVIVSNLGENNTSCLFNFYDSENNMFPMLFFSNFLAQYKQTFYLTSNKTATFPLSLEYRYVKAQNGLNDWYDTKSVNAATRQAYTGDGKFLTTDNKIVISDDKLIKCDDLDLIFGDYNGYPYWGRKAITSYKANFPYTFDFTNATTRSYLFLKLFDPDASQFVESIFLPVSVMIVFADLVGTPTLIIGPGYKTLDNILTDIQTFSPNYVKAIKKENGIAFFLKESDMSFGSLNVSDQTRVQIDSQHYYLKFVEPHVCLAELPIFKWELASPITFFGNSLTATVLVDDIVSMLNARNNGVVVAKVVNRGYTFLTFTSSSSFIVDETTTSEYYQLLGFKQAVSSTKYPVTVNYL